jgi:hypothetical protein
MAPPQQIAHPIHEAILRQPHVAEREHREPLRSEEMETANDAAEEQLAYQRQVRRQTAFARQQQAELARQTEYHYPIAPQRGRQEQQPAQTNEAVAAVQRDIAELNKQRESQRKEHEEETKRQAKERQRNEEVYKKIIEEKCESNMGGGW